MHVRSVRTLLQSTTGNATSETSWVITELDVGTQVQRLLPMGRVNVRMDRIPGHFQTAIPCSGHDVFGPDVGMSLLATLPMQDHLGNSRPSDSESGLQSVLNLNMFRFCILLVRGVKARLPKRCRPQNLDVVSDIAVPASKLTPHSQSSACAVSIIFRDSSLEHTS